MEPKASFRTLSVSDFDPKTRGLRKRRFIAKSRSGCRPCKLKKVKCDEETPLCRRCRRNGRQCVYDPPASAVASTSALTVARASAGAQSPTSREPIERPLSTSTPGYGTPTVHILQHFQRHWEEIFPMPYSSEILELSKSSTLVRNTVLAVAACHLRTLAPTARAHQVAESFQLYMALQCYRNALDTPRELLGLTGINTLLIAATLLNIAAFALPSTEVAEDDQPDPRTSWVFSTRENRLGWMVLQAGLRPLLIAMSPYQPQIADYLGSIFLGVGGSSSLIRGLSKTPNDCPSHWVDAFELWGAPDGIGCESISPYRIPATVLANLRNIEPIPRNAFLYLMFMGKTHGDFRTLLLDRDDRALWLVGYWLGLMCRFDGLWWSQQRARRDYKAVCMWLESRRLTRNLGHGGALWPSLMDDLSKVSATSKDNAVLLPDRVY
ncbi:hypothetical protein O9K51_06518 [Purpureocillium lavendulum]|uniref:Zn(2)-C6 fungal-type domain-containing protein n=1 Tax=Purpureocillium lavendulum TaxID=1247861 RepID=A0AB34FNG4_9HYPO|nr:hypothetical protein O9K51_06518 [Purpureocillium lavendulum]